MTHTQFVVNIGVLNRDISDDDVGSQKPLKHVETNVSLPANFHCRTASDIQSIEGRIDKFFFDVVEIDVVLRAEGPNDEGSHFVTRFLSKTVRSDRDRNDRSLLLRRGPARHVSNR